MNSNGKYLDVYLSALCAYAAAGVACVTLAVLTIPTDLPENTTTK